MNYSIVSLRKNIFFMLLIGFALCFCFGINNSIAKDVKLVLADQSGKNYMVREMGTFFMDKVEKYSNGKIKFDRRVGGVLGDYMVLAEQCSMGAIDVVMIWPPSDLDSRFDLGWVGWLTANIEEAEIFLRSDSDMFNLMSEIFADNNMKLLMIGADGISGLHIRKGTGLLDKLKHFPADAKGMKARIPSSKIYEKRARNLGFSPVAIPYSEVYTGLQLGTFDVRFCTQPAEMMAFGDVLDGWIGINELCEPFYIVVSEKAWKKLSSKDKKIMQDSADATAAECWKYLPEYTRKWHKKAIDKFGVRIVELPVSEIKSLQNIARKKEWPLAEKIFGKPLMERVYKAAKKAEEEAKLK